jgi:hypothetical protein
MRTMTAQLLAVLSGATLCCAPAPSEPPASPLPPVIGNEAPGLPTLPSVSPRSASYSIDARLDPEQHTIAGSLTLDWHNT